MAMKTAIVVEISSSGTLGTFHFQSKEPTGTTLQPLKRYGYRTDKNYLRSLSPEGKNLVTDLFEIPGIIEVLVGGKYEVAVAMGRAYSIEDIIPRVTAILAMLFYCHEDRTIDVTVERTGGMYPPIRPLELRAGVEARIELERIMRI